MMLKKLWAPLVIGLSACSPQQEANDLVHYQCDNPSHPDKIFTMSYNGDHYRYVVHDRGAIIDQGKISSHNPELVEQTRKRFRDQVCDDTEARHSAERIIEQYESAAPGR